MFHIRQPAETTGSDIRWWAAPRLMKNRYSTNAARETFWLATTAPPTTWVRKYQTVIIASRLICWLPWPMIQYICR